MTLTETDKKILQALAEPATCTQVGSKVFGGRRNRAPQAWARPAGKVISRLFKAGLVKEVPHARGSYARKWVVADYVEPLDE